MCKANISWTEPYLNSEVNIPNYIHELITLKKKKKRTSLTGEKSSVTYLNPKYPERMSWIKQLESKNLKVKWKWGKNTDHIKSVFDNVQKEEERHSKDSGL